MPQNDWDRKIKIRAMLFLKEESLASALMSGRDGIIRDEFDHLFPDEYDVDINEQVDKLLGWYKESWESYEDDDGLNDEWKTLMEGKFQLCDYHYDSLGWAECTDSWLPESCDAAYKKGEDGTDYGVCEFESARAFMRMMETFEKTLESCKAEMKREDFALRSGD